MSRRESIKRIVVIVLLSIPNCFTLGAGCNEPPSLTAQVEKNTLIKVINPIR